MTPASTIKSNVLKSTVLATLAVAFLSFGAASPALALDDDGKEAPWKTLLSFTGLGGKTAEPEIDYRDRAPLVLPPKGKAGLRPPSETGIQRGANWPQDPDVQRRAKATRDSRAPSTSGYESKPELSKAELMAGRGAGTGGAVGSAAPSGDKYDSSVWVNPDVLRSQVRASKSKDEALVVGVEPERKYLTQPPPGYRKPTKEVQVRLSAPDKSEQPTEQKTFFNKLNPFASDDD